MISFDVERVIPLGTFNDGPPSSLLTQRAVILNVLMHQDNFDWLMADSLTPGKCLASWEILKHAFLHADELVGIDICVFPTETPVLSVWNETGLERAKCTVIKIQWDKEDFSDGDPTASTDLFKLHDRPSGDAYQERTGEQTMNDTKQPSGEQHIVVAVTVDNLHAASDDLHRECSCLRFNSGTVQYEPVVNAKLQDIQQRAQRIVDMAGALLHNKGKLS